MSGTPPTYTLTDVAGDTVKFAFQVVDKDLDDPTAPPTARDLTGHSVLSQVRKTPSSEEVLATWEIDPLDDTGVIRMKIPGTVTQTFATLKSVVSDVQLTDPEGDPDTILTIILNFTQDVTRE